jgi:hypothetical protein
MQKLKLAVLTTLVLLPSLAFGQAREVDLSSTGKVQVIRDGSGLFTFGEVGVYQSGQEALVVGSALLLVDKAFGTFEAAILAPDGTAIARLQGTSKTLTRNSQHRTFGFYLHGTVAIPVGSTVMVSFLGLASPEPADTVALTL